MIVVWKVHMMSYLPFLTNEIQTLQHRWEKLKNKRHLVPILAYDFFRWLSKNTVVLL